MFKKLLSIFICLSLLIVSNSFSVFATTATDNVSETETIKNDIFDIGRALIAVDSHFKQNNSSMIDNKYKDFIDWANSIKTDQNKSDIEAVITQMGTKTTGTHAALESFVCNGQTNAEASAAVNWILSPISIIDNFNKANYKAVYNILYHQRDYLVGKQNASIISIEDGTVLKNHSDKSALKNTESGAINNIKENLTRVVKLLRGYNNKFKNTLANQNVLNAIEQKGTSDETAYMLVSDRSILRDCPRHDSGTAPNWSTPGDNEMIARYKYTVTHTVVVRHDAQGKEITEECSDTVYAEIKYLVTTFKEASAFATKCNNASSYMIKSGAINDVNKNSSAVFNTTGAAVTTDASGKDFGSSYKLYTFNYSGSENTMGTLRTSFATYKANPAGSASREAEGKKIQELGVFTQASQNDVAETGGLFQNSKMDSEFDKNITNQAIEDAILCESLNGNPQENDRDYIVQYANLPIGGIRLRAVKSQIKSNYDSAVDSMTSKGYMELAIPNDKILIKSWIQIDYITGFSGNEVQYGPSNMFYNLQDDRYYKLGDDNSIHSIEDGLSSNNTLENDPVRILVSQQYDFVKSFMTSEPGHMLCLQYYPVYKNQEGAEMPIGRKLLFDKGKFQYNSGVITINGSENDIIAYLADPDKNNFDKFESKYGLKAKDFGAASGLGGTTNNTSGDVNTNGDLTQGNNLMNNNKIYCKHEFVNEIAYDSNHMDSSGMTWITKCRLCGETP